MKMTRSRELLASIMQLIISFCTVILLFSFVLNLTSGSQSYVASHFPVTTMSAECDAQLTEKFEMLSDESGFPIRVFEMVKTDMPTNQAVSSAFDNARMGEDSSLYSQNLVDYFYGLCEDYASGNNLDYDKSDLTATAEKAARLYSETVGIVGASDSLQKFSELHHSITLAQFISFAAIVVCAVSTYIMYTRKRLGYCRILAGLLGGGVGTLIASAVLFVIKPVLKLNILPAVYTSCFSEIAGKCFSITAMLSLAVIVLCIGAIIQIERHYQKSKDKVQIT